ncbi:MAG: PPOX class F420-dependent oxidoreductase [Candidatus Xenobia bacterium]
MSPFQEARFLALTTFRKNGQPVTTPVWFVEREGKLYVRTGARSGKVKRIRNQTRVQVAPALRPGHLLAEARSGQARILGQDELAEVNRALSRRYGLQKKLVDFALRLGRVESCALEIELDGGLGA